MDPRHRSAAVRFASVASGDTTRPEDLDLDRGFRFGIRGGVGRGMRMAVDGLRQPPRGQAGDGHWPVGRGPDMDVVRKRLGDESWMMDELRESGLFQQIEETYPDWYRLPSEECDYLRAANGTLWLLLNYYSNETRGVPICCLDHAPMLNPSRTVQAVTLAVMFVISFIGNSLTVYSLSKRNGCRSRRCSSSVYALIFHLGIADLLVTVTCLFGETAWTYSVSWLADNFTCKLFKFSQMFSLYLSTYVLVSIGLDRFIVVKYPMRVLSRRRISSRMVLAAWVLSLLLSSPQFLIFRVNKGPFYEDFYQCVTYGSYTETWQEQLYAVSTLLLMFVLPLAVIVWSYASAFVALRRREKKFRAEMGSRKLLSPELNRRRLIQRARTKSMRISLVIVIAFVICWTPYYVMMIIFLFHEPNEKLAKDLQNGIFFFGMSNSLINPIIYGAFHRRRSWTNRRDYRPSG